MTKINAFASTLLVVGMLTACGGGSNPPEIVPPIATAPTVSGTDVPVAATTDVTAVVAFAKEQQANTSESSDPLVLGNAMLAVDDTSEPAPV